MRHSTKTLLLLIALFPLFSWGGNVVTQQQFGRQVVLVGSGETLTFYDHMGTDNIGASNSYNAQSLTVFQPAEADMAIELTFLEFDIQNENKEWADYPGEVRIFNGDPDPTASYEWPTQPSEVTDALPAGDVVAVLDGIYHDKTYISNAESGILSVGLIWHYAKACKGWKATVRCVEKKEMTVTGARTDYSMVSSSPNKRQDVSLASVIVSADGTDNADAVTQVNYRLGVNDMTVDGSALRLWAGDGAHVNGSILVAEHPTADGDTYTFTLNHPLQQGDSRFTIVGDIEEEAPIGGRVRVDITSVNTKHHPEGITLTQGSAVTVTNPAIVLMNTLNQAVTVGDVPIMLYDDGGKDGEITAGFNGSVTFIPESPDKKISVDFSKVALANGSIYYQYVKVYNGKQVDESKLLKTLRHGETALVRSTSADGSITVFLGNNGTGQTADGIEAMVSQFTPQPMTLTGVTVEHPTLTTVCADDKNQPVLCFNVVTHDTEPALTLDEVTLTTAGTWTNIAAARLYYGGINNLLDGASLVASATVAGDAVTITPSSSVTLYEGDNYFFVTYDISDAAVQGSSVDCGVSALTLSGKKETMSGGNPEGVRLVDNVVLCYADQGTVTRTVNGSLTFRTRDVSEYQHLYEAGNDDRVTIFKPKHAGMVCQIDFSEFGLQYTNSYYGGVKSKFKIISGSSVYGPVLWELNNVDDKDIGPNQIIRSTADDGSLTILFCPNDWNYNSTGWEATVSEYQSHPMTIDHVAVTQASTDIIPNQQNDADLLTINIVASGDLSVISLNSVTIDTKDSPLSKLSLYYLGRNDGEVTSASIGTATVGDGETVVTLTTPLQLQEGTNYFRLRGDLSVDATGGDEVDARVVSVNAGGTDFAVTDGDPDGVRMVKDIYLAVNGVHDEIGVSHDQHILFYDDGGETGKASKKFDGTVTFYPRTEGEQIRFDFLSLSLGTKDTLYIYNGAEVAEAELLATLTGANAEADYFVSSAPDGKLTARFVVKSSFTQPDGFAIDVSSYAEEQQSINEVSVTQTTSDTVLAGATDVLLYTLGVNVSGEGDKMTLKEISFNMEQAENVQRVSVYVTDTESTFTPITLFGTSDSGHNAISGDYAFEKDGTYYFHVAIDVKSDAPAGSSIVVTPTLLLTDRSTYELNTPSASLTVVEGFSGTLTVGAGGDYGTIQSAVDAVSGGISGPTTISILPGIYNEKVYIPAIPGTSANNPLVLESQTGSWEDVKIYFDVYDEPPYSDDKMKYEYGVMTIGGSDYVTLRGLDITTEDLTFPGVVHITGESRHATIEHCHIHCAPSTSYSTDIKLINTYAENEANRNNDYLTVRDCLLEGGYIGIRMGGTGYVVLPKERGGVVEDNIFMDQGSKGIYVMEESGVKVRRNTIRATQTGNGYRGIDFQVRDTYDDSAEISSNHIYVGSNTDITGLHIRLVNGTAEHPVDVFNNEVVVAGNTDSSYGMVVNTSSSHLRLAHNTVTVNGNRSGATFWVNDIMGEGVTVDNNIFLNNSKGYVYRFRYAPENTHVAMSHQVCHTTGTQYALINGSPCITQDTWTELSGESGSYDENVTFLHSEILEPAEAGNLVSGTPLSWVTTDISGTERASVPTIGAYEYNGDDRQPVMNDGYPGITDQTDTSARITLSADMNCEAFILVLPAADAAPDIDQVVASIQSEALHKDAAASSVSSNLTTGEQYVAYVVLRSLRGTCSMVYHTEAFVAEGHDLSELPTPVVAISGDTSRAEGESFSLTATVSDGVAPYHIVWLNGKHEVMVEADMDGETHSIEATPTECDDWQAVVTDANGIVGRDTVRLIVTGAAITATFENLYLDSESYWNGSDLSGSFVSGSYLFENVNVPEWQYWYGFAFSNQTATSFAQLNPDQYNNAVGHGYDDSENFVVSFPEDLGIRVMNKASDTLRGFYVTNNAWVVDAITNGDGMTPGAFKQGDYLMLYIYGEHADGTKSQTTYYLADYRSSDAADHYYLDTWQWVDLRSLGDVERVTFKLESSRVNAYGMTTPGYFCLDNFNGEREETDGGSTADDDIDLSEYFTFNKGEGTVTYGFADPLPNDVINLLELTPDGHLYVEPHEEAITITIIATQHGKQQFVTLTLDATTGISSAITDESNVDSRYTLDGKRISTTRQRGVQVVKMKDGSVRKEVKK